MEGPVATAQKPDMPIPLSGVRMLEAVRKAKVSHLVVVPDTVQKTFLSAARDASWLRMIVCCTEDEAMGVNAGLYASGHRPMLSIQNNGLYACVNTLRGIALDGQVPTLMLIGQYGHKPAHKMEDSPLRMVRLLEPTLTTWGVPFRRLWSDADLDQIPAAYDQAWTARGPGALIVPIPTVD